MKHLVTLTAAFACFLDPAGHDKICVNPANTVTVLQSTTDCAAGAKTKIITLAGTLCVHETPQQVIKLLGEASLDKGVGN